MARTIVDYQGKLIALGFDCGPDGADGIYGADTMRAVRRFQQKNQLPLTGQLDSAVRLALFPEDRPAPPPSPWSNIVNATIADYFLNFITSKINWAAGITVGLIVTWISTQFGFHVPPDVVTYVTGLIASGGFALVGILRTFFNKPKVVQGGKAVAPK